MSLFHISFSKLLVDSNQLTAKGLHKHEGYNFCDRCHEQLYDPRVLHPYKIHFVVETRSHMQNNWIDHQWLHYPQNYGPKPGSESIEEARLREAREKVETKNLEITLKKTKSRSCFTLTITSQTRQAERERKLREIEEMRAKQVVFLSLQSLFI